MAYIVVLDPLILVGVTDATGVPLIGGGDNPLKAIGMVAAATALVAGVMTIVMGFVANFPLALAAGLGLNAFVGYGLVVAKGYTWPEAMGMIVIEGTVVLICVDEVPDQDPVRGPGRAQEGDRRGHRPVPRLHRALGRGARQGRDWHPEACRPWGRR